MIKADLTIADALNGEVEITDMTIKNSKIEKVSYRYIDVVPCYSCTHIPEEVFKKIHTLTSEDEGWELKDIRVCDNEDFLLKPLNAGEKVTAKRKSDAMLTLARKADVLIKRPDPENDAWAYMDEDDWQLAELKKWGKVRLIKDKITKNWIATTYGTVDNVTGYHGLDVNTGKMISQEQAEALYHRSPIKY